MSKTISLHHIVFATKYRKFTLPHAHKSELIAYIFGMLKNRSCYVYAVNGYGNHIHILTDVHPSIALATLAKDIKTGTYNWLKNNPNFPDFWKWGEGYYASSLSPSHLIDCQKYINNQDNHHGTASFNDEIQILMFKNNLTYHPDDLT